LGVLAGGVLTAYANWRFCLFVNLPIAALAAAGVRFAVRPGRGAGVRVDAIGAVLATAGLMAIVFGFSRAETDGWGARGTIGALAAGAALLVAFVLTQRRVRRPLLPLRVVLHRRRAACYLAVLGLAIGMFAALFFLTFHLQNVLGYGPVRAGIAFLPLTVGLVGGVRVAGRLLPRVPVRALLAAGLLVLAAGLALLGRLPVAGGYPLHVLPVFLLVGLGTGGVLITANSTATLGAGPDTAVAGAMVMTSQQVGASLGTALLATVAGTATAHYLHAHPAAGTAGAGPAAVHGFAVASSLAALFLGVAALAVYLVAGPRKPIASA
jgi:predicted MFS family arabinose efflux permease